MDLDYLKNKYYLLKKLKDDNELSLFIENVKSFNPNLAFCFRAELCK